MLVVKIPATFIISFDLKVVLLDLEILMVFAVKRQRCKVVMTHKSLRELSIKRWRCEIVFWRYAIKKCLLMIVSAKGWRCTIEARWSTIELRRCLAKAQCCTIKVWWYTIEA